jgi:hypothetical protein
MIVLWKRKERKESRIKRFWNKFITKMNRTKSEKLADKLIKLVEIKNPNRQLKLYYKMLVRYPRTELMEAYENISDKETRLAILALIEGEGTIWNSFIKMRVPQFKSENISEILKYLKSSLVVGKGKENLVALCGKILSEKKKARRTLENAFDDYNRFTEREKFSTSVHEELKARYGVEVDFKNKTITYPDVDKK